VAKLKAKMKKLKIGEAAYRNVAYHQRNENIGVNQWRRRRNGESKIFGSCGDSAWRNGVSASAYRREKRRLGGGLAKISKSRGENEKYR
jgi:hypothetical protein